MDFDNVNTTPGRAAEALGLAVLFMILVLRPLWSSRPSTNVTQIFLKPFLRAREWFTNTNRPSRPGFQQPAVIIETQESDFPDGWWNDPHRFDLERRAFFSKSWHYLLHESAIPRINGAWLSFTFGGFPLALVRGDDKEIRCFHNVCRHRAYKVFDKPSGIDAIPWCQYHNWKYDSRGNFYSAKDFRHLKGFATADKNLFQAKLENRGGALWVKLEVDDWESSVGLLGRANEGDSTNSIPELEGLDKVKVVKSWEVNAQFNWKVIARLNDHPQPALFRIESVSQTDNILSSLSWKRSFQSPTLLSPLASLHPLTPTLFLTTNMLPTNEGNSVVRFELISTTGRRPTRSTVEAIRQDTERGVHALTDNFRTIMRDPDDDSFMRLQKLDGAWKVDVETQRAIREQLSEHRQLERRKGRKLHPAGQQRPVGEESDSYSKVDSICNDADSMFCTEKEDDRFGW